MDGKSTTSTSQRQVFNGKTMWRTSQDELLSKSTFLKWWVSAQREKCVCHTQLALFGPVTKRLLKGPQVIKTSKFPLIVNDQWKILRLLLSSEKLGNKFLPGQFWPCLSFSALRHGLKSKFLILWTKAQASLLLWYEIVWWRGREIWFEWFSTAVISVDDHSLQFYKN